MLVTVALPARSALAQPIPVPGTLLEETIADPGQLPTPAVPTAPIAPSTPIAPPIPDAPKRVLDLPQDIDVFAGEDGLIGFTVPETFPPGTEFEFTLEEDAQGTIIVTFYFPDGTTSTNEFIPNSPGPYNRIPTVNSLPPFTFTPEQHPLDIPPTEVTERPSGPVGPDGRPELGGTFPIG